MSYEYDCLSHCPGEHTDSCVAYNDAREAYQRKAYQRVAYRWLENWREYWIEKPYGDFYGSNSVTNPQPKTVPPPRKAVSPRRTTGRKFKP